LHHLPLHMPTACAAVSAVVHPAGHDRHAMPALSSLLTQPARYSPFGQSRTTFSSQNLPGGTWQTSSLSARGLSNPGGACRPDWQGRHVCSLLREGA
jgi:hypothetical protein